MEQAGLVMLWSLAVLVATLSIGGVALILVSVVREIRNPKTKTATPILTGKAEDR